MRQIEAQLRALADHVHPIGHVGVAIASRSFPTMGVNVALCSIRSLSELAHGISITLLTRAAGVSSA
jgi:flavin prenyltransferase